jgi:tetratricopeptide (TPR) repeat protein
MLIDGREFLLAISHLTHSSDLLQSLIDADPGNAVFRRGQSIAQGQLAVALRGAGKVQEGVGHAQNYLRLALALSHDAPESAQYHIDVGISQRKLSEALLAAGEPAEALRHANEALQVLCQEDSTASDPGTQANCGRAQLAAGMAHLAMHNPKAAQGVLRKAVEIASALKQADPKSAVPRSDQARAQAALAAALAMNGDDETARSMYQEALANWVTLLRDDSITVEDAYRSDQAAKDLAKLRPR